MPDPELKAGVRCRLKHDPGRIGVLTDRSRSAGAFKKLQVQFPEGAQFVPEDQLEAMPAEEDALDLLQRGRLGDELDLRLTLAHARLTGRLADVIYSMDVTGTDFYAHQFKPVVRLLNSVARGILIADEVGLGKTIEAGLLWTELRTRYDFRRLLVLCPAVLREKWQRELKNRFGVDAEILDARGTLNRLRQAANDETPSFAVIASLQGLRPRKRWRESTDGGAASELARFLLDREQADPLIDMCVVDEAHHLRNRETTTSQLARLARTVSDYIVLLTATPIHLRSNDLHELLRLVDEGMFDRGQSFTELLEANAPLVRARELVVGGAPSGATSLPEHLELELRNADRNPLLQDNRQLKRLLDERVWTEDFSNPANVARVAERLDRLNLLGHTVTRTRRREVQEHRPERDVKAVPVEATPAEMEFYSNVTRLVRDYCMASDVSAAFLEVTPQRQMSSSMPAALRQWQQGTGGGYEALDDWTDEEGPLKSELIAQARQLGDLDALWTRDSKYERLSALLSDWLHKEPDSKVIVFSSYLATLDYLEERLKQRGIPCMVLQGSTSDKDHAVEQFRQSPSAQVLLSSEVGSEGIDLQFAKLVINYDLPWNPMRVEQRIGRVDRLGQKASQIHVRNLFYKDTIDARIHERLMDRLGIFEGALGGLEPILGEVVRNLRKQLFTTHLTPEQEDQRIEQARFALENRRRAEEELEREAAHLTAYGDYVLRQIGAARDLHRSISAADLVKYVTDYLRMHYRGCLFRQIPGHDLLFDIDLSNEARFDLANFIRQEKLDGDSRLTRSSLREVRCRFENSTVPRIRRGEEAINQFHPLVRFVSSRLEVSEERRRPAVAVRLGASRLLGKVGPGIYGFSVQRWSVRGLRHAEKLSYAAIPVAPAGDPLRSGDAELLIGAASSEGAAWLSAQGAVDTRILTELVEQGCVEPSERAFSAYVEELEAENEDRADMLQRMAERRFGTQRQRLTEQLQTYETMGPARLVPATMGRLRALEARADFRQREIERDRELKHGPAETVCVGLIRVEPN